MSDNRQSPIADNWGYILKPTIKTLLKYAQRLKVSQILWVFAANAPILRQYSPNRSV
jgi:hypothetical protein